MVSKTKRFKRILIIIITSLLIFLIASFAATKFVYDGIFVRTDCNVAYPPNELLSTYNSRTACEFYSGENKLMGYLYKNQSEDPKDTLVVIVPGFKSCADSYLWQTESLLSYGWSVFSFNTTGSCTSEGDSSVGFPQEINDLEAALKYIEAQNSFGFKNIVLLGHSRGGYAACCALGLDLNIAAVVSISGVNSAMEGVIGSSVNAVGPIAYGNYPFLWGYQALLFGAERVNMNAQEIIKGSNVPVLLVHGENDDAVPIDKYSIYSHFKNENIENVELMLRKAPDNDGHTDLLFDADGSANDELMEKINEFLLKNIG